MSDHPKDADVIAAIRKRPGLFVGWLEQFAVASLIKSLVFHSLEGFLAGKVTRIKVDTGETGAIRVFNDGPGFSLETANGANYPRIKYLTELPTVTTAEENVPQLPHSLDLLGVNALSRRLTVISHRDQFEWSQVYERGHPVSNLTREPSNGQGTTIEFIPDEEVLHALEPNWATLRHCLFELSHFYPGVKIDVFEERFHSPGGMLELAHFYHASYYRIQGNSPRVFHLLKDRDEFRVEVVAIGRGDVCQWKSWCNGIHTGENGTHVDGFADALKEVGWMPESVLIHVHMTCPRFAGSTTSKLCSGEVRSLVREFTLPALRAALA